MCTKDICRNVSIVSLLSLIICISFNVALILPRIRVESGYESIQAKVIEHGIKENDNNIYQSMILSNYTLDSDYHLCQTTINQGSNRTILWHDLRVEYPLGKILSLYIKDACYDCCYLNASSSRVDNSYFIPGLICLDIFVFVFVSVLFALVKKWRYSCRQRRFERELVQSLLLQ
jgi:hypothetical protein